MNELTSNSFDSKSHLLSSYYKPESNALSTGKSTSLRLLSFNTEQQPTKSSIASSTKSPASSVNVQNAFKMVGKHISWAAIKHDASILSVLSNFTPSKRGDVDKFKSKNKVLDTIQHGIFKTPNLNYNPFVRSTLIRAGCNDEDNVQDDEKTRHASKKNDREINTQKTLPIYNGGENVTLRKCDNNTLNFDVEEHEWMTSWLSFEVWDDKILTQSDDFIGAVNINISDIKDVEQCYYAQLPLINKSNYTRLMQPEPETKYPGDNKKGYERLIDAKYMALDDDNNDNDVASQRPINVTGILHVKALKNVNNTLEIEILAITNMMTLNYKLEDKMLRKFWRILFGFVIYLLFYALIMFLAELHTDTGINSYKESIWFALVTVTTLGYGDIYAQTSHSKILNSFFIFFNIFIVVTMVVNLLGYINHSEAESLNNRLDHITTNPMSSKLEVVKNVVVHTTINIIQPPKLKLIELTKLDYESKHTFQIKIYVNVCLFLLILLFGFFTLGVAVLLTGPNFLTSLPYPGYDCDSDYNAEYCSINTDDSTVIFIDSLYYTIASMSFVGYGDIYPKPSAIARILGSIFILFAAMMIIRLLCLMSGYMIWQHNKAHSRKRLGYKLTSSDKFFEWDFFARSNHGYVSRFEYLIGRLLKMDIIDFYTINELMTVFYEFDTEGNGFIDVQNIRAFTQKIRDKLKKDKAIAKYGEDGWNELTNEWKSIKEKQQQLKIEKNQLERQ